MKKDPSRMRYVNDSFSAGLCYLAIIFNVIQFVALYADNAVVPDLRTGADVIINILMLLITFWASEEVKVYERKWSLILIFVGLAQCARVLWLPLHYRELEQLVGSSLYIVGGGILLSGISLLLAAASSFRSSTILKNYLSKLQSQTSKPGTEIE